MTDLALDPLDGDIVIAGGDLVLITGADAVAQDANLRVALFKGEWPLDTRVGIDYRAIFFDRRPPEQVVRAVFGQVLRETAGVATVDRMQVAFDRATRSLNVSATVTTTDGTVVPVFRDVLVTLDGAGVPEDSGAPAGATPPNAHFAGGAL
ncbi:MAG TPA: hypothetical protein VNG33_11125 [Polyangiaceae bacterium]|nr:hypothetical protein [Polyangiaceae bacterium]